MENQYILRSEPKKHLVIYPILLSPLLPSFLTMLSHQQLRPQHTHPPPPHPHPRPGCWGYRVLQAHLTLLQPASLNHCPRRASSHPLSVSWDRLPSSKVDWSSQLLGEYLGPLVILASCLRGQEKQLSSYKHTGCSSRGTGSDLQVVYSKVKQSTVPGDPTPSSGLCSLTHMWWQTCSGRTHKIIVRTF